MVDKFEQAGIDCFAVYTPHSTLMKLEYPTNDPDIRRLSVAATAGSITAEQVEGLQVKAAVIGSSLRGEVGLDVIQALKCKGVLVAADMQGFVRVLRGEELKYEPWAEMPRPWPRSISLRAMRWKPSSSPVKRTCDKAAQFFCRHGSQRDRADPQAMAC